MLPFFLFTFHCLLLVAVAVTAVLVLLQVFSSFHFPIISLVFLLYFGMPVILLTKLALKEIKRRKKQIIAESLVPRFSSIQLTAIWEVVKIKKKYLFCYNNFYATDSFFFDLLTFTNIGMRNFRQEGGKKKKLATVAVATPPPPSERAANH